MTTRIGRLTAAAVALAVLAGATVGCSSDDDRPASGTDLPVQVDAGEPTAAADFDVRTGTQEVTVTGAKPKQRLSLVDADGNRLMILRADRYGQAHFGYLANELMEVQTGAKAKLPTADGKVVEPGDGYTVRNEDTEPVQVSAPFRVYGRDDHPDEGFYDEQAKVLVPEGDETSRFGYVTMRDGVELSVMVRLPGPVDAGPSPPVVEFSGYGPANPDSPEPGTMIAGLLGFATVGVNMRGTGCSGGVFDVFNTAQQTDGYDVIEAIARQPWVANGKVGMVGLSYSGITQLYAAATRPPSLAAIAPLSVLKDPWLQQWPGGVYNGGFTKQWLAERDKQSSAGGTSWVQERIEGGDETCAAHQELREQNIDFEAFGRSLVHRPALADERDLSKLVREIDVPVFLTGAWQDEQTGPQFGDMLANFDQAPVTKFTMFNGRHPDGYTPRILSRWYEFLSFYVRREVPKLGPGLRALAPAAFEDFFHMPGLEFEPDRFGEFGPDDYDAALARYESEPDVRVLFDQGADPDLPGKPVPTFEATYDTWPPADTEARTFYLGDRGALAGDAPTAEAADRFLNDPDSAAKTFFSDADGYDLLAPTWDFDWEDFDADGSLTYVSEPFREATVLGGPGRADLWVRVPDGDADVQVSVSLIDTAGTEWLVTNGLLRLSDRQVSDELSDGLLVDRTFAEADSAPMPEDRFEEVSVSIPPFAQAFRPGDRLKIAISSPGRNFAAWTFTTVGDAGTPRDVGRGGDHASSITLGVLPGIEEVPPLVAPCPSLRGQACRPYEERTNTPAG